MRQCRWQWFAVTCVIIIFRKIHGFVLILQGYGMICLRSLEETYDNHHLVFYSREACARAAWAAAIVTCFTLILDPIKTRGTCSAWTAAINSSFTLILDAIRASCWRGIGCITSKRQNISMWLQIIYSTRYQRRPNA